MKKYITCDGQFKEIDSDEIIRRFRDGELITIAGRPGTGKTNFVLNIAKEILLNQNKPVAMFSLGTPILQLYSKMVCLHSGISETKLEQGDLTKEEQIIDYFQLINVKGIKKSSPKEQFTYAAKLLKDLAMNLCIPVLVTSMLSRGNKIKYKPDLSQLGSATSLEKYSDKIILLHRPGNNSYKTDDKDKNVLEIMD
ncbi:MAG: hypothetical protein DRJ01_18935 [Bacteroidetes bacterium]|nr:MAG: hypothetical protein DRJ01_18935 [Bacteroidota bacterium]